MVNVSTRVMSSLSNELGDHCIMRIWPMIIYTWDDVYWRNELDKFLEFCKTAVFTVGYLVPKKDLNRMLSALSSLQ